MRGVREKEFIKIYGKEIEKLKKDALLTSERGRLFLTPRGMDLANRVFVEFT
jgi:coproporphyrinogen III oxidase-like Fe-S oxidoreductase